MRPSGVENVRRITGRPPAIMRFSSTPTPWSFSTYGGPAQQRALAPRLPGLAMAPVMEEGQPVRLLPPAGGQDPFAIGHGFSHASRPTWWQSGLHENRRA